jgi:hypothetical protein
MTCPRCGYSGVSSDHRYCVCCGLKFGTARATWRNAEMRAELPDALKPALPPVPDQEAFRTPQAAPPQETFKPRGDVKVALLELLRSATNIGEADVNNLLVGFRITDIASIRMEAEQAYMALLSSIEQFEFKEKREVLIAEAQLLGLPEEWFLHAIDQRASILHMEELESLLSCPPFTKVDVQKNMAEAISELGLSLERVSLNAAESVRNEWKNRLDVARACQRTDPEDQEFISSVLSAFGPVIPQTDLATFRRIQNGKAGIDLPDVFAPFALQQGEGCHWSGWCGWYEKRKQTRKISYGGPRFSFKLSKNISYKATSYSINAESIEVDTLISQGQMYVTNKRLVMDGDKRAITVRLKSILRVDKSFSGRVDLLRSSGSPVQLEIADADAFIEIVAELL